MSDDRLYDSTFDMGGLPGGDVLFDPEGGQGSVPPVTGGTWQPDPTPSPTPAPTPVSTASAPPATPPPPPSSTGVKAPVPPPSWPQPPGPYARRPGSAPSGPPPRPMAYGRRKPQRGISWGGKSPIGVVIALVFVIGSIVKTDSDLVAGDFLGSTSGDGYVVESGPDVQGIDVWPQMVWDSPGSIRGDATVKITITSDVAPLEITDAGNAVTVTGTTYQRTISADQWAWLVIVSGQSTGQLRCTITADGVQVAHAVGDGNLDCVFDPAALLEIP